MKQNRTGRTAAEAGAYPPPPAETIKTDGRPEAVTIGDLITELRSGQERRIMAAAEAAADALELLEERIAIMSEDLTAEQWEQQKTDAAERIAARRAAI